MRDPDKGNQKDFNKRIKIKGLLRVLVTHSIQRSGRFISLLDTAGNFCHFLRHSSFNIRNINGMSKVHINAFTVASLSSLLDRYKSLWWTFAVLSQMMATPPLRLRMTASTWKHNQGTVALFQQWQDMARLCSGFDDRKCHTWESTSQKYTIGEEFFFAIKINALAVARPYRPDPTSPVGDTKM